MDERCRNQEAAMEFPHPNVGGPPSRPDNREGTFCSPPHPPGLPSLPTFALSLYFHFTGTMEEVAKQRAEERTGGLLEQRWGGPEVLRGEDE